MSRIPSVKSNFRDKSHDNFMGGLSYDITNPIHKLRVVASSCFFGEPMYYYSDPDDKRKSESKVGESCHYTYLSQVLGSSVKIGKGTPAELMESAIDDALSFDPEQTLMFAVELRQVENIRTTPQVILVRAAHNKKVKGTSLVRQYGPKIIQRADEPSVCISYHKWRYGKSPIPNSLKKAIASALSSFNEYQLSKYRMETRGIKTVDVVNLVHPKNTEAISKLVKGTLTSAGETWESIVSAQGSTKESWEKSVEKMGHMALLRNLRNLFEKKVDPNSYLPKLVSTAKDGKQLPFRYYSAYNIMKDIPGCSSRILDSIEECLELSIGNLPHINGKVMSLSDNSGSAHGTFTSSYGTVTVSDIANLTAVLTGKCSDDGYVGIFGDRLEVFPIRKKSSIFDDHKKAKKLGNSIGGNTENGIWLFWDNAIKKKEHWDHVFVYSDMQAGHGGLYGIDSSSYSKYQWNDSRHIDVPKLIAEYRKTVNPNVLVYLVQVAGYSDTIIPEFFDKTYIMGGWSDSVIRFAAKMAEFNVNKLRSVSNNQ